MKPEEKNKEVDLNNIAFTVEVDSEVIGKVKKGEITHIVVDLTEHNQELILETIDGHLILLTDEMPDTYHGCYLYNKGVFPYPVKQSLAFMVLSSESESCLTRIIGIEAKPGTRFSYQGDGKPIVEDAQGESCVWEIQFELVPVLEEPRTYLMRWNPAISSFTEKDYEACVANARRGMFRINWSISEWEEAHRGDRFYMMRVGDDKAGIVFEGQFISDPYPADDWAGSSKRRMYVDMICTNATEPGAKPSITLGRLQESIPEFEWQKGHSGVLLPEGVAAKLDEEGGKE